MAKVLIVDDSMYIRSLMADMLSENKFEIAQAESGEEMFRLVDDFKPDVILIDIVMPGISGLEALEMLHEREPEIKVIVCSAQGSDSVRAQAEEKGAAGFIQKPFGVDILMDAIYSAFGK